MIIVKSPREIALMRTASKIVAEIHVRLKEKVVPGITTLELDRLAEEWTKELGSVPAFKGYRGYQHTLCISVHLFVLVPPPLPAVLALPLPPAPPLPERM